MRTVSHIDCDPNPALVYPDQGEHRAHQFLGLGVGRAGTDEAPAVRGTRRCGAELTDGGLSRGVAHALSGADEILEDKAEIDPPENDECEWEEDQGELDERLAALVAAEYA